ncbi:MAG: hypothetical protein ACK4PI_07375 [Tepidisphaerales bacterium]
MEQLLQVHVFTVFAKLGVYVPRPELKALCQLAMNRGGQITHDVVSQLLPDASPAAVSNVIGWCSRIGLCHDSGVLTGNGQRVAREGKAPLLEEGVYRMWGLEHPAVGGRILHFQRIRPDPDLEENDNPNELPMQVDCGEVWKSAVDETEFEVRDLPSGEDTPLGYIDRQHGSVCKFKWTVDFSENTNEWWLEGTLRGGSGNRDGRNHSRTADVPMKTAPVSRNVDLVELADKWMVQLNVARQQHWNRQERRLDLAFTRTNDVIRRTFRSDVSLQLVRVGDHEAYQDVKIRDVPVGPLTADDAVAWMKWRLAEALRKPGYRSPEMLGDEYASVTVGTPLQSMTQCPDASEMLREMQKDRRVFWRIAAGHDLTPPRPVSTTAAGHGAGLQVVETVRLDRLKNPSMKHWVSQILGPVTPRRVLLCDRYVCGDANLKMLKLLVDTLRSLHPNVKCTVVTLRDPKDAMQAKRIAEWTGVQPVWHDEVFGKPYDQPHDRYFLVDGGADRWGWQMSNSPLAARPLSAGQVTEDSPLAWRDLVCSKLVSANLRYYPFLFNWLTEGKS